jgi:hypothetical protein
VLTPAQVRNCLRSTGSPQQDAPGRPATQRIGNRPDIRAFATCAFGKGKEILKEAVKEIKEHLKDTKDTKERKDATKEKELKEFKDKERKELKEKELKEFKEKEHKEFKEKEHKELKEKELKEFKEKDKDIEVKTTDKVVETRPTGFEAQGGAAGPEERLAALEATVQQLVHFIGRELRPDLSDSALQAGSQSAKDEKDLKDAEKQSEG